MVDAYKDTYADDSAEKEQGHECYETTFEPLLAVF